MMRTLILALVAMSSLLLSACGLSPVYGKYANTNMDPSVKSSIDSVYVDTIPNREGQKLRNLLIDRLVLSGKNAKAGANYKLQISAISENIYDIGIAKDDTATRSQIRLSVSMSLVDTRIDGGKPLLNRSLWAVTSFNQLASQYTTLVTEDDARTQAIQQLSDQIVTQLELYFANPTAFEPKQP